MSVKQDSGIKTLQVFGLETLYDTELAQVIVNVLRIKQDESLASQMLDEVKECDLRTVRFSREHRLATKRTTEREAI
jgi:hypothetical protein